MNCGRRKKMEAVGRLAGGHRPRLQQLLTVIMGQTQLLRLRGERHTPQDGEVAGDRESRERAAELTRQLRGVQPKQVSSPRSSISTPSWTHVGTMLRRVSANRLAGHEPEAAALAS